MNIFRKKSTNSQSSFAILDESQDSVKPKSACSIGCDPIFEWKERADSSTNCDISFGIDESDLDAPINESGDKENQEKVFWKRAVAVRQELTDELNESAEDVLNRSFEVSKKAKQNHVKWDRFYLNSERARVDRDEAGGDEEEENGSEKAEEEAEDATAEQREATEVEEDESEEEEDVDDEDEEEECDESLYHRLNESDDQESE